MASTNILIPVQRVSHSMGRRSELSNVVRILSERFDIPQISGQYQGDVYLIMHERPSRKFPEIFREILRYEDKVCTATFQQFSDGTKGALYRVRPVYLDGQLDLLRATDTNLGLLICGDLQATRKKTKPTPVLTELMSTATLANFSEVEKFISGHILYH